MKIAVFIDFDNVEIGVKTTLGRQFDVGAVLEAVKERGEIITKIAYGDWKRAGDHGRTMAQHAVRLVQRVMTPRGDKNGADINLALDALEMAFTHDHINAFVIVGGDSDFITLVEKLKQYDKKVFVIGGRSFTSQVMQKNCTEFIAYENVAGGVERQRTTVRPDRARPSQGAASLDQALPLVQRAIQILTDREVSPQLGLLKSTLLQLDSSFSERDYGAGTFRDFAERLEQRGFVTLKHMGRTTLVELVDRGAVTATPLSPAAPAAPREPEAGSDLSPEDTDGNTVVQASSKGWAPPSDLTLADGVALVRAVLAEATTPPRWPMYLRQMKQFIRTARPDFDERRYGSLQDLLRACQKAGLVRLERDRQGGLRAFAGASRPASVPHGWAVGGTIDGLPVEPMPEFAEGTEAVLAPVANDDTSAGQTELGDPATPVEFESDTQDENAAESPSLPDAEPVEQATESKRSRKRVRTSDAGESGTNGKPAPRSGRTSKREPRSASPRKPAAASPRTRQRSSKGRAAKSDE
ncbi:MAG: NYN domain-containing protein [Acidobacteriota bacterium]